MSKLRMKRRKNWAGHVALTERRVMLSILVGKPEVKIPLSHLSVCERIILNWI
jgi:hypothetical protein